MAYVSALNILTRCREVIDGAYGLARTVPAARFSADFPADGLQTEELARRSVVGPRFDVRIGALSQRAQATGPTHSPILYDLEVNVRISRTISTADRLVDSTRDDTLALLTQDVDVVTQAFGYPGNLRATEAAAATGILGGVLSFVGIDSKDIRLDDAGNNYASYDLRYAGTVAVAAEVASTITSPAQINAPLFAWFRSDLGVTTTSRTGVDYVTAWADQSAFDGYQDLSQSTAISQPQFVASDPLLNGHPSIAFTTDFLTGNTFRNVLAASASSKTSAAFLHGSSGFCVFLVYYEQSYNTSGTLVGTFSSNESIDNQVGILLTAYLNTSRFMLTGNGSAFVATYNAGTLPALTPTYQIHNVTESPLPRYYLRGDGAAITSGLYTGATSTAAASAVLHTGASPDYLSGNFYGNIAEIAIFKGTLNSAQIALLEAYAAIRYAI